MLSFSLLVCVNVHNPRKNSKRANMTLETSLAHGGHRNCHNSSKAGKFSLHNRSVTFSCLTDYAECRHTHTKMPDTKNIGQTIKSEQYNYFSRSICIGDMWSSWYTIFMEDLAEKQRENQDLMSKYLPNLSSCCSYKMRWKSPVNSLRLRQGWLFTHAWFLL